MVYHLQLVSKTCTSQDLSQYISIFTNRVSLYFWPILLHRFLVEFWNIHSLVFVPFSMECLALEFAIIKYISFMELEQTLLLVIVWPWSQFSSCISMSVDVVIVQFSFLIRNCFLDRRKSRLRQKQERR